MDWIYLVNPFNPPFLEGEGGGGRESTSWLIKNFNFFLNFLKTFLISLIFNFLCTSKHKPVFWFLFFIVDRPVHQPIAGAIEIFNLLSWSNPSCPILGGWWRGREKQHKDALKEIYFLWKTIYLEPRIEWWSKEFWVCDTEWS